jgi:hypothetical protein
MPAAHAIAGRSRFHWRYAVLVLAALLVASGTYRFWQYGPTAFDPVAWRNGDNVAAGSDAPRLRMADGLVRSGMLRGQSAAAVRDLLGPASPTEKWRDWDLVYWLGPERGPISIDSEWLVVRFDRNGVVSEARVVRD